ncbi:amino acid adenylation domain-containing protein [Herbaspirillum sp. GCM10030257]|uniref:amino acid adenylation domain-containing protein n=1 Tax=Herbaspirillum sp. GCM10030257 TaxID=3273393 RepID=UPI00360953BC
MSVTELLRQLDEKKIALTIKGEELIVQGKRNALEPSLLDLLRNNKSELIQLIATGKYTAPRTTAIEVPKNGIPNGCNAITPEMLPLVELSNEDIARIVGSVEGGAANIQDIYPLAPLQEGILFHYQLENKGDMYLAPMMYDFATKAQLNEYINALQAVITRHDILRTSVFWKGITEPVQVVWRKAILTVEQIEVDPQLGNAAENLRTRFDPRHYRIDLGQAPLMRVFIAYDKSTDTWSALWLSHHLLSDPTTHRVLLQEIEAHLAGRSMDLPAPIPFRDFVAQTRFGLSRSEHETFFKSLLGDVDEPTAPFGLMNVHGDGSGILEAWQQLDTSLARRLRETARRLVVSPATLCHMAWALTLARLSGRDDVVFGTVLIGRTQGHEGTDRALGLFMNTLPVRIRIGEDSVQEGLRMVHALMADLLRHEHASLALAQRCSAVAPQTPLFTSILNYRHNPHAGRSGNELASPDLPLPTHSATRNFDLRTNYALTLNVNDEGVGFVLNAQACSPINPQRVCTYVHTSLARLIDALERAPATPLNAIDVLPPEERQQLLVNWNATSADYPRHLCIHELFEAHAAAAQDAIAVVHGERSITYGEINANANRLARYLQRQGILPGMPVALLLDRSIALITAEIAVVKCGAVFVTLDLGAPVARHLFIIDDCQASMVVTDSEVSLPVPDGVRRLDLDTIDIGTGDASNLGVSVSSETAAHITYTSGSTGQPKGVIVPHRAIGRVAINNGYASFNGSHRFAYSSNPAWDANTLEVWVPLLNGASIAVIDQPDVLDPQRFRDSLRGHAVNVLWISVGLFNQYADFLTEILPKLNYLMVGGDALDPRVIAQAMRNGRPQHLINGYGPTETAVFAITHEVDSVAEDEKTIPIGRPISNTQIYILDSRGHPTPVGVTGEIHIGGVGVALGYVNQVELTAERFIPNPFSDTAGALMYKTGDLGRYRDDGVIEFRGRNDFQVKVRGFRIELGEIEARLSAYPAIRESVVLVREDRPGDKRLVAYYTAAEGAPEPSFEALRAYLQETLPDYMVPTAFVRLDTFPLNPNNKLDRKALPEPGIQAISTDDTELPGDEIETALAKIWCAVLKVDRVGRSDDFFDLGGHSLLAVRTASRVRDVLGVEISVTELFLRPTLKEFANSVKAAARSSLPPVQLVARDLPLALSFAQQRLWFLAQMDGVSEAYHIPVGFQMTGSLDVFALRKALDCIVARHEALRTTFALFEGKPVQRILPKDSGFSLQEHDLRERPECSRETERLLDETANAPFNLIDGPLIRGCLLRTADDQYVMMVTMHHIVSDGWSLGLLTTEFCTLYRAFVQGQPDPLPPLAIQYADYAAWQRRWVDGAILERQVDYWQRTLADAPVLLDLPTDRPRPAQQSYAGGTIMLVLDEQLTAALKELGQRHGATLFMTMLAAWAAVLARLSGQTDLVVGTPTANRLRAEIEPLIGFFVNTLAIRLDLSGNPTLEQLLLQVKSQSLAAQENQDLPFEQVVELVRPPRSMAHSPLFQVLFGWQNNDRGELDLPGLEVAPVSTGSEMAKFDMSLNLAEADGRIVGALVYAVALFDQETVERHLEYVRNVLVAMVTDDQQPLSQVGLLSDAERQQILEEWNRTDAAYSLQTVHTLFEEQAGRNPRAIGLVVDQGQFTYGELNAKANRLAHYLRNLGVVPETRVAICVDRGLHMVVGLLAILKAGGAYVPMDPDFPAERLAYMLQDSAPAVLLTQRHLQRAAPPHQIQTVYLGSDTAFLDAMPDTDPSAVSLPNHLAYVIYTSGSTGRPKGVAIAHGSLSNFLASMAKEPGLEPEDVLLAVTSLSFDIAGLELYLPLTRGARLVCARREAALDPAQLSKLICDHDVSVIQATPSTWRMLLQEDWSVFPRTLKVLCGGESLPSDLAESLLARVPAVWNMYGPTETTIWSAVHRVTSADVAMRIGRPVANTRIYILDESGQPVPVGIPGELHIAGDGLARGYLNRDELTAERFIDEALGGPAGSRMYKTGDRARYLPNGDIEFLGRLDDQVKVRGFRIEPAEIEAALATHPQVKQCVVVAREDMAGDTRLAAYAVLQDEETGMESERNTDQMGFSLFYFGADTYEQNDKYRLYLEAARYADENGFEAVWTPERHFHEVGSLYPNPAILNAALATVTKSVHLRAGSVVLPLHNPIRVAEEWSVVDNLSRGRVGVSFATGWMPRDFVLAPDSYANRKDVMASGIETVKALWRGEQRSFTDGSGKQSQVTIYPKPVQAELPVWVTSSGNPETFIQAGKLGANILTHLLGQSVEEVAANITLYRQARARHGYDPDAGRVTLMIHTFMGEDFNQTLENAREPFIRYMRSHLGLLKAFAKAMDVSTDNLKEQEVETIVSFAFERYSRTASLIGTPETCLHVVERLRGIGVDEMACLVDWIEPDQALQGLRHLNRLRQLSKNTKPGFRDVRKHLARILPEYMLPGSVTFLDRLPLTPNGKLDRKALPAPDMTPSTRTYEAPVGETEILLATIWADVLRVEKVGRHDDFFELGGHSLLAVDLIARMKKMRLDIDVRTVFSSPTIAEMALSCARIKEIAL